MAYLQITLDISNENRMAAAGVYQKYKTPFLTTIDGATSKELLIRDQDVQVCTVLRPQRRHRRTSTVRFSPGCRCRPETLPE
jgi:hypothetical protein